MNDKEKKAFVARMKKGKKNAAKGKSTSKGGGKSKKIRLDPVSGKKILYEKIGKWKKEGKNYVRYSIRRVQH
jgi:hypothetical protein